LIITPLATLAHFIDSVCTDLTATALSHLDTTCANLGPNSLCYGAGHVEALPFGETIASPDFNQPADQLALTKVATVHTAAPDATAGTMGVAIMNVQANLPAGLPGREAVYILMGDVEVENLVTPEEALVLPSEPLLINTVSNTDLWAGPVNSGQPVGQIGAGTPLAVDGFSPDGEWLRVYFEYQHGYSTRATAWVNKSSLDSTVNTSSLPVIQDSSRSPMQDIQVQGGFDDSGCGGQPVSQLVIQGPSNIETDVTVNGADIRISSTVVIRILPGNILQLIVISGIVTLNPDSPNPIIVPAGYVVETQLDENGEISDNPEWSEPRLLTQDEVDLLTTLELLPANTVNYSPSIPTIVCPSGVGVAECEVIYDDQAQTDRITQLCNSGQLSGSVCGSSS
jgi:hypothetical protein